MSNAEQTQGVPAGYVMVPVEPTPEILEALFRNERDARAAWAAALSAKPRSVEMESLLDTFVKGRLAGDPDFQPGKRFAAPQVPADEFNADQWWYAELEGVAKTPDQRRAMAVVRNMMRQFDAARAAVLEAAPQAQPVEAEQATATVNGWCPSCGEKRPVSFRPGVDIKTGEPFEDLCCDECHYVIATLSGRVQPPSTDCSQPVEAEPAPVNHEHEAAINDALGLVSLPPIYVDRATHAALVESSKATGKIIQAVVRDRLAPYAVPSAPPAQSVEAEQAPAPAPDPVAWRVRRHDAPNYWIVFLHKPVDALLDPQREVQPLYAGIAQAPAVAHPKPAQPVEAEQAAAKAHVSERTAFEAWLLDNRYDKSAYPSGIYVAEFTRHAWITWQARAALAQPAQPVREPMSLGEELREFEVHASELGLDLTRFEGIAAPWLSVETSKHWQTWRAARANR